VAGIVVNDEGKVLVIRRRDNGHWEPPGGVLELDETFEEGVRREVHEETGIWADVQRLTGVYKNMAHGIVALVFRCVPLVGKPVLTEESQDVRWMSVDDVCDEMSPAYSVRVRDAFDHSGVHVRAHDGVDIVSGVANRSESVE
jgi:mutator protein MutT